MKLFAFFCVTALKTLVITPLWFMKRIILVRLEESYEWSPSICEAGKQCSYNVWRKYSTDWLGIFTINGQYEYGKTHAIIMKMRQGMDG